MITMKKKLLRRKKKVQQEAPSRITNETVAEHREKILTDGKKFKYPHQYLRHKLVINAILLTVLVLVILGATGWFQLYKVQNTSNFMYRITKFLPLSVASVDGTPVRYSDYLMRYRSQELWLRNNGQLGLNPNDERQQLDFFKRSVLDGLEMDMFAKKLAEEQNVVVTDEEVDAVIEDSRTTATGKISKEVYDASTLDTLGYSPDEYRHIIYQALLRQKIAYRIDSNAQSIRDKVIRALTKIKRAEPNPLEKVVIALKKQNISLEYGESGLVPKNNRDGGLTQAALQLKDGEVSGTIEATNGTGYYFVQRVSSADKRVSYRSIRIPLKEFENRFEGIKSQGKIKEFITLETTSTKVKD